LDLRATTPALSASSDIPIIETKPDSQAEKPADSSEKDPAAPSDEGKKPEVPADPDAKDDDTAEQPGEPDAGKKKPAKGVQKALDRLTREREEQRERAEAAEKRLAQALDLAERVLPKPDEQQEPKREDFEDPEAYIEAKAEWIAERQTAERLEKKQREEFDNAVRVEQEQIRKTYNERRALATAELPDFEEIAAREDIKIPMPCVDAILLHENGPKIQYWLGQHPDEAAALFKLNPIQAVGRIHEIGLQVKTPVRAVSKAPEPIKPLGSRETATKDPSEMSMEEYAVYARARDAEAKKVRSRH
jgi:hypothetical protein